MKWIAKACLQSALAALPMGEQINHRLQRINSRRRGHRVLDDRIAETTEAIETLKRHRDLHGQVVVEIGTGWDALPTLFVSKAGAAQIYSYDHEPHLRPELFFLAANAAGHHAVSGCETLEDGLRAANIKYIAPGDATKTGLEDNSVDVVFSLAVLEHVPEHILSNILVESARILKPGGIFYALIGLHDHFNGFDASVSKINFLRHPEWLWKILSKNRIAYHNRLRQSDFIKLFKSHGADILESVESVEPADLELVQSMKIDDRFKGYDPRDLATTKSEVVLRF